MTVDPREEAGAPTRTERRVARVAILALGLGVLAIAVWIPLRDHGTLLGFLRDLRDAGNAYVSVRRCVITRTGQAPTGTSIVPRLRAECDIDLITIMDRAAKT